MLLKLKIFFAKLINKLSLLMRAHMPWLFKFLSKQQSLRKIYLRNKQFANRKNIPPLAHTHYLFPNKNEINLALEQAMTKWPLRKRLHG